MEKMGPDWKTMMVDMIKVVGDTSHKVSFQEMIIVLDACREGKVQKGHNLSGVFLTIQLA